MNTQQLSILEDLILKLSIFIEAEKSKLVRVANAYQISLYWEIGNYIRETQEKQPDKMKLLVASDFLKEKYGEIFAQKNLRSMLKLAILMPDASDASILANLVSWAHIKVLLQVEKKEARLFYAWFAAVQGLTVTILREKIGEGIFEQAIVAKPAQLKKIIGQVNVVLKEVSPKQLQQAVNLHLQSNNTASIGNPLKNNDYLIFLSKTDTIHLQSEKAIFSNVVSKISTFQKQQHSQVNHFLNIFFWQTGKYILKVMNRYENDTFRLKLLDTVSYELMTKYGGNFEVDNLKSMLLFAGQLTDSYLISQLAYLASWPNIQVLLHLHDPFAQLFYARLSVTQCLNPESLQMVIMEKNYEHTAGTRNDDFVLADRTLKTNTKKHKGNVSITTTLISQDGILYNPHCYNVFKDSYFVNFPHT